MKIKITRLEKIKEDGIPKRVVIGITASDETTGKSSYIDWSVDVDKVGKTKKDLINYIKSYLQEATNQSEIDSAKQQQAELQAKIEAEEDKDKIAELQTSYKKIVIPKKRTRIDNLADQLKAPKVEFEQFNLLSDSDRDITL